MYTEKPNIYVRTPFVNILKMNLILFRYLCLHYYYYQYYYHYYYYHYYYYYYYYYYYCYIIITELTHSKTILENTVEIEPQLVALDFKNLLNILAVPSKNVF